MRPPWLIIGRTAWPPCRVAPVTSTLGVTTSRHALAARILAMRTSGFLRSRPVFKLHRAVTESDLLSIEAKLKIALPSDLSSWLLEAGFGDIADQLSFRADWLCRLGEGDLRGAVVFAQDELGNFYAYSPGATSVIVLLRSSPQCASLAPDFTAFMEELERRKFELEPWVNSLVFKPYGQVTTRSDA